MFAEIARLPWVVQMMVVVADSSPLNYLALIEAIDLLLRLYGRIVVPQQVVLELIDPAAPYEVRKWASALPGWVDVRSIPPSQRCPIWTQENSRRFYLPSSKQGHSC
jgi:predicted nucleic acid-binding protein